MHYLLKHNLHTKMKDCVKMHRVVHSDKWGYEVSYFVKIVHIWKFETIIMLFVMNVLVTNTFITNNIYISS